jgi:hypothetical protein
MRILQFSDTVCIKGIYENGSLVPKLLSVDIDVNGISQTISVDQRPATPPPPAVNLYRVAAERWPELHGQPKPPSGGPLVQVCSGSTKGGKFTGPLTKQWQNYILKWNTFYTMEKIRAKDYGPSQGVDPVSGKLKWNFLVWPCNADIPNPNMVNVIATSGVWSKIETIPLEFSVPDKYSPTLTPWLFHNVCENTGNPVLVRGYPIVCPVLGAACWVPSRALIKM